MRQVTRKIASCNTDLWVLNKCVSLSSVTSTIQWLVKWWKDILRRTSLAWRSGYCYLNKGECNLNQSKDDSFVEWVAKNNSWNNRDCHKIHEIFLINCFVFVITPVWKNSTQFGNDSNWSSFDRKNIATNCSQVTVLILAGWTKKPVGHYPTLKLFPSDHQEPFEQKGPKVLWVIFLCQHETLQTLLNLPTAHK